MPRNKYPEETIKKILDTSLQLFLEKGYEQTTVLDIVDNLGGLTRGAFYHHFKSKEEVMNALLQRAADERNFYEEAMNADVPNGLARVKMIIKMVLEANIESEQRNQLFRITHSLLTNPRFLAEHIKDMQEAAKQLAQLIEEGMKDRSIKYGNAQVIAELLLLMTNIWIMPNIFPSGDKELLEKRSIIEQIMMGLGYPFFDDELRGLFHANVEKISQFNKA